METQQRSILIFSKDRALQLEATLHSFLWASVWESRKLGDTMAITVLYKTTNAAHEYQYAQLRRTFPGVVFQSQTHFYDNVLLQLRKSEQILMMVDDTLFVRQFDLRGCFEALNQHPRALAYSLRLGLNTRECYMKDGQTQALPSHAMIGNDQMLFEWQGAEGDFGYPFDVSCSIHRSQKILSLLGGEDVILNPNQLEHTLAGKAVEVRSQYFQVVCFDSSVSFSLPLNLVQDSASDNRYLADDTYTADALLRQFSANKRIHWEAITGMIPKAAHQIVEVAFTDCIREHPENLDERDNTGYPLVTVVIPCFNYGQFVLEAVQSVKDQIYPFVELIVVDGGSDDSHTIEVLKDLEASGVTIHFREGRHLVGDNRNYGITRANGELICCLDADDKIAPDFILKTVLKLLAADADIMGTAAMSFGADDAVMGVPVACDYDSLLEQNQLITAALFKKSLWQAVGGYEDFGLGEDHIHEDWHFWVKCAFMGANIQNLASETLFQYRVHDKGSLSKQSGKVPDVDSQRRVIVESIEKFKKENTSGGLSDVNPVIGLEPEDLTAYRPTNERERLLLLFNCDFMSQNDIYPTINSLVNRDLQVTVLFENQAITQDIASHEYLSLVDPRVLNSQSEQVIEWLLGLGIYSQCSSFFSESYHHKLPEWKKRYARTHFSEIGKLNSSVAESKRYLPELWEGYRDPTTRNLKVEVCAETNSQSQGSEIWILSMRDPEGNEWVEPAMQTLLPAGWTLKPNDHAVSEHVLFSRGTGSFDIRLPACTQITFLMHDHSGQVNMVSEGKSEKVDLYSAEAKLFQFIVE